MILDQRILAFHQLGSHLRQLSEEAFETLHESVRQENPWFTKDNVRMALRGIEQFLQEDQLKKWTSSYSLQPATPKTIALVLAGNIPLVGFHDFLCVLISGHKAQLKLSSKDSTLFRYIIKHLVWLEQGFKEYIDIKEDKLENFDAVIATGSDNSARYFEFYFGKYPHIIRKNRTSCAILNGEETTDDLKALGSDIFSYFGLGCRNVSTVYIPQGYDLSRILSSWDEFKHIIDHHKYRNNYDYQKSILLVNGVPHLDNGFILLQENSRLVSPIAVLYYEYYATIDGLRVKLKANEHKIQCLVGSSSPATTSFSQAQYPALWDYADQIDTLKFLDEL
jgi:hypothetical protein